jgi:PAS domain S-box-containing protein
MSDKTENGLSSHNTQSEQIAQIIHHLVKIESELQKYQSTESDPLDPQTVDSTRLQAFLSDLQPAIDSLTHLDSSPTDGRIPTFSSDVVNQESEEQERDFPSADYLMSLRKRAEQTSIRTTPDIKILSNDEIQHAFHELEVHQVELRMQNEELLRVQIELETSLDRFSSLYDFAPVGFCTIDKKGVILEANVTLHQLLHVPERTLIRTNIQHYIQEHEQDRFYLYHRAAIKSNSIQRCELMMGTDERDRFVAQFISRTTPGQPNHLWLVISDISHSRRAAEFTARYEAVVSTMAMLEIERNRYRNLFDFAPDGYLVTDDTGAILDVNQAGAVLLCSEKEPVVGTHLVDFISGEDKADFQSRFNAILEKKLEDSIPRLGEWEIHLAPAGREPFPTAVTTILLREKPGAPVQIRWMFRDVSARKYTEAELGKTMARFRALFEESSLGIRLLDLQGNTLTCNAAIQEILGYTEEELRQIPFTKLTEPLDQEEDESGFYSVVSGEFDRFTNEKRCIRKDGKLIWVHQVMFLVRDAANEPAFLVAMTENISERKQMESELTEVRRHLIEMLEVERLMLAQDLHDGPMQDLYGVFYSIKSLEDKLTGEDAETIASSADTINQVVNVLRGFAGQLRPPTLKSYGLEKTIRSHAQQFQEDQTGIMLTLNLMPDRNKLPEQVSLALFRIYQQSLANILRHAHATSVTIRLILDDQQLQLEIEDNGKGFEVPPRLVDLARKGHYGLVGAAERAEAVGGTLTIDSSPGRGTTIIVNVNLAVAKV